MLATARMVFALVVAFWPNQNSMVNNGVFFGCVCIERCKIGARELCFVDERRLLEGIMFWLLYCPFLTKFLLLVFRILIFLFGVF